MNQERVDLRLRVEPDTRLDNLRKRLSEERARAAVVRPRHRSYLPSRYRQPEVFGRGLRVSEEEMKLVAGGTDDSVLLALVQQKQIYVSEWRKKDVKIFLWQACMERLAVGADWSYLLDAYAAVHGWPEKEDIEKLRCKDGSLYSTRRPREIMEGLRGWAKEASESELLDALDKKMALLSAVIAGWAMNLTSGVISRLAEDDALLAACAKSNAYIGGGENIWNELVEKVKAESKKDMSGEAPETIKKRRNVFVSIAKHLLDRGIIVGGKAQELTWEWAIARGIGMMSAGSGPKDATAGHMWASEWARMIWVHPSSKMSAREIDGMWAAAPSWWLAVALARNPNLSRITAEKICFGVDTGGWSYSEYIRNAGGVKRGGGLIEAFIRNGWLGKAMVVRDFVVKYASQGEMGMVIEALPPAEHEAVVKGWLARDTMDALVWLKNTRASDRANLSPKILAYALVDQDKTIRLLAAQAAGAEWPGSRRAQAEGGVSRASAVEASVSEAEEPLNETKKGPFRRMFGGL